MKPVEFEKAISKRFSILMANIKFTYQIETAFRANNWANVISTCFYTLSMVLFINVIYANVKLIAGYSKDEMLLFMFVGQIGYYVNSLIQNNLAELIDDVNKGRLDNLLVRPVPSLFYVTFKKVGLFSFVRDCVPPMIILGLFIKWSSLPVSGVTILTGSFIVFLGMICSHVVHFLSTLPVFWLGESNELLNLSLEFESNIGKTIPYEGFSRNFRLVFSTIAPVMITAGIATSVMLHKTPIIPALALTIVVTVCMLFVRQLMWKIALRKYTSASS